MNALPQHERRSQRAFSSFARALWAVELSVQTLPLSEDEAAFQRPRFSSDEVWLPATETPNAPGSTGYRLAATAHIAAHRQFGGERFVRGALKPIQIALISLIEDARVEHLARAQYPGLSRLWSAFYRAAPDTGRAAHSLLARLARALHDEDARDGDPWVEKGRALFFEQRAALFDSALSRRLGSVLGNDLGQMRIQFNPRHYLVEPAYRDDHVGLWQIERAPSEAGDAQETESARPVQDSSRTPERRRESPELALESRDARSAHGRARSANVERGTQRGALDGACDETAAEARYPEWDYVIRAERAAFSRVRETPIQSNDSELQEANLLPRASVAQQLARRARWLGTQRPLRLRRKLYGDRLDLPALTASQIARRAGTDPDPRVYRCLRFQPEPPLLLVLLDLSQSSNAIPDGSPTSLLDLARDACLLLAASLGAAPGLAIHGFSSNGRHDVGYQRFKEFDELYGETVVARLAGMRASRSTRLGAAMRHAGSILHARSAARKILLVISDGEPSDIDVHDEQYLLWDAWHATKHNRKRGVTSFCLGLEPRAEASVQRIFGAGNYLLLRRAAHLADELGRLCCRLARP